MRVWLQRYWQQGGLCYYCEGEMTRRDKGLGLKNKELCKKYGIVFGTRGARKAIRYFHATIEHFVRRADGGTLADGWALACKFCNSSRGTATVEEHKAAMMAMVAAGKHPVNRQGAA